MASSHEHVLTTFCSYNGKRRCRMHGGAHGSGAPKGERDGHYRHGFYTAEAIAERQALKARPVQCSPAALAHATPLDVSA
jgi:hypothetical protein